TAAAWYARARPRRPPDPREPRRAGADPVPLELRGLLRRGYADGDPAERSRRPGDRRGDARRADALGDPGHVGARRPLRAAPAHGGLPDDDDLRSPRGPPDRAEPDRRPARDLGRVRLPRAGVPPDEVPD